MFNNTLFLFSGIIGRLLTKEGTGGMWVTSPKTKSIGNVVGQKLAYS